MAVPPPAVRHIVVCSHDRPPLLRFDQVKKTKNPRSRGQGSKTSASRAGKSGKSGGARRPGRIPVRGAFKTGGVQDRAAAPSVPAPRADIEEARAFALAAIDAALDKK